MANYYYEKYGLPLLIKKASKEGKYAQNPDMAELALVASVFGEKGRLDVITTLARAVPSPFVSSVMEIMNMNPKDKLDVIQFKQFVYERLGESYAVVVNALIRFNNKVEVFTSFLTADSQQLYAGLIKGKDLSRLIKNVDTPLKSKYANCAMCMHYYGGGCPNEPSVKARLSRPLKKCSGCESVYYCSKECQKADFIRGHSVTCEVFAWLSPHIEKEGTEGEWSRALGRMFGASVTKALKARGADIYPMLHPQTGAQLVFE